MSFIRQIVTLFGATQCTLTFDYPEDQFVAKASEMQVITDSFSFLGGAIVPDPGAVPS